MPGGVGGIRSGVERLRLRAVVLVVAHEQMGVAFAGRLLLVDLHLLQRLVHQQLHVVVQEVIFPVGSDALLQPLDGCRPCEGRVNALWVPAIWAKLHLLRGVPRAHAGC